MTATTGAPTQSGQFEVPTPRAEGAAVPREVETARRPELRVSPQVAATQIPQQFDGLDGNRQIALTPFPNLHLQSGPLSVEQLPWYQKPKDTSGYEFLRTVEFESAIGGWNASGLSNGGFGTYNVLDFAFPFWREKSVGVQAGAVFELNTFPQLMTGGTVGFFHRAMWPEEPLPGLALRQRLSWGTVVDGLFDSEHRSAVSQVRTQFGYALEPHRECGFWFVVPVNDDRAPEGSAQPVLLDPAAAVAFYYRHVFVSELDATLFIGESEHPGGAYLGLYLSKRFATQLSWTFSAMKNLANDGGYSVFAGVRIHFWPIASYGSLSNNPQNEYRPFMRTVDHINFLYRVRPL